MARPRRQLRARALGLAIALFPHTLLASPSRAGPPAATSTAAAPGVKGADVETAEQFFTKLDYDKANDLADKIVKQRELTHDQLVRAYRVLAVTNAILGKEEAARDDFLRLLLFDPEYTVDQALGPKVTTPFIEARGLFRALPSRPGLEVVANVRADGGQLRVTTRDPTHITKKVVVGYRWTSAGEYTVSQIAVGEGTVEVAAATSGRNRLDFYAQALDEHDNAIFEAGSPQVPKSAFASPTPVAGRLPEEKRSIFASPLFWVITGAVVVAGGATATYFALRPAEASTSALLSPVIICKNEACK